MSIEKELSRLDLEPSPSTLPPYVYQPLKESEIRVLVLLPGIDDVSVHCRLDHVSLKSPPSYETISYAWGDPTKQSTIEADGGIISVTVNLHSALRHLRFETEERIIWADAVCINQQDPEERSIQVLLMGQVYAHARQVVVWLGEEDEETAKSIETFEKMDALFQEKEDGYRTDPSRWNKTPNGGSPMFQQLYNTEAEWAIPIGCLAKRPWFSRRWVIQEVAKSPAATVVCGKKHIPWVTVAEVIWSIHQAGCGQAFGVYADTLDVAYGIHSILLIEMVRRDVLNTRGSKMLELITSFRFHKCLDPRDVIYSALGVISDLDTYNAEPTAEIIELHKEILPKLLISPDYLSSTEEVYHNFVLINILKKQSLLPLSITYVPPEHPILNLPSWVPDLVRLSTANSLMHLRNEPGLPFKASKGTKIEVRFTNSYRTMHIRGRVLDTLKGMTVPADKVLLPEKDEKEAKEGNLTATDLMSARLGYWFDTCFRLLDYTPGVPGTLYGLSPEKFMDFSRTLVCNLLSDGAIPSPEFSQMVLEYIEVIDNPDKAMERYVVPLGDEAAHRAFTSRLLVVEGAMNLRLSGWCFCSTVNGRMGRVLEHAKKGDKIVIVDGAEVPYVLRPREEGGWTFMGSCYIHGLMNGEGMDLDIEDEEFEIH